MQLQRSSHKPILPASAVPRPCRWIRGVRKSSSCSVGFRWETIAPCSQCSGRAASLGAPYQFCTSDDVALHDDVAQRRGALRALDFGTHPFRGVKDRRCVDISRKLLLVSKFFVQLRSDILHE